MEPSERDFFINSSTMDPIPAGNGEAVIWDSTRVPHGAINYELNPATGLYYPTGTFLDSMAGLKAAFVAITPTTQGVTFKVYYWMGTGFVLVNGTGKAVAAGVPLAEVVPLGGRATKITYLAGATPPSAMAISVRLRYALDQPAVASL